MLSFRVIPNVVPLLITSHLSFLLLVSRDYSFTHVFSPFKNSIKAL